jgi:hypothetical protein
MIDSAGLGWIIFGLGNILYIGLWIRLRSTMRKTSRGLFAPACKCGKDKQSLTFTMRRYSEYSAGPGYLLLYPLLTIVPALWVGDPEERISSSDLTTVVTNLWWLILIFALWLIVPFVRSLQYSFTNQHSLICTWRRALLVLLGFRVVKHTGAIPQAKPKQRRTDIGPMTIDDIENYTQALQPGQSADHAGDIIAWFVYWLASRHHLSSNTKVSADVLNQLEHGSITPTEFLLQEYDGQLSSYMLPDNIAPFVQAYYSTKLRREWASYYNDYDQTLVTPAGNEANITPKQVLALLDQRYREWQTTHQNLPKPRLKLHVPKWAAAVIGLAALGLAFLGWREWNFQQTSIQTTAKIIDKQAEYRGAQKLGVSFMLPDHTSSYAYTEVDHSTYDRAQTGQTISVKYDPHNPDRVRAIQGSKMMPTWAEKTLVLGIGFIFILIAQRYRKVFYRKLW